MCLFMVSVQTDHMVDFCLLRVLECENDPRCTSSTHGIGGVRVLELDDIVSVGGHVSVELYGRTFFDGNVKITKEKTSNVQPDH